MQGGWALTNQELQEYMTQHGYGEQVQEQRLSWMSLTGDFSADLTQGQRTIAEWMPELQAMTRMPRPLAELFLAQQVRDNLCTCYPIALLVHVCILSR